MGTPSTCMIFLLLGLSTCCLALPRRGSDDFPKPVLPKPLEKAGTLIINNAAQDAATRSIPTNIPTNAVVTPIFASNSILDSVKNVVNAITVVQKMNAPFAAGSGDNSLMKKIGDYWQSLRVVPSKIDDDKCNDEKTKHDISCTTEEVHGFPDILGKIRDKLKDFGEKWITPINKRIAEIKDDKEDYKEISPGGTTIVTKPNTFFSGFVKVLDMFGLDGTPEVIYEKPKEKEEEKEKEEDELTPQDIKENALYASSGGSHLIKRVEKHNYWTKSVNAGIKLAGLGIFGALCAQNCGIENLLGFGTPLPPLDPEDEAANLDAALADAAGDTDGDGDVDGDDGRRRDTAVDDSYHGYDHYGEYVPYDLQQLKIQPEQKNHVKDDRDPGYAYGTFPGWYPPEVNVNNNNNNNNHLVEPERHPDFSNRLLHSRDYHPQPIHEEVMNEDQHQAFVPVSPQPVFRGARMLQVPK